MIIEGPPGLDVAKPTLENDIKKAFDEAMKMGIAASNKKVDNSEEVRATLASNLANAIDAYVKAARVNISSVKSTVPVIPVLAPPPSGKGFTTSTPDAVHEGFGELK